MARSRQSSLASYYAVWAILCVTLGAVLAAIQLRLYEDRREAVFHDAEAEVAAAEQALLRAFDLANEFHDLLRIKHGLLDFAYSTAGIALDRHLRAATRNGRFGMVQLSLLDPEGQIRWSSWPGATDPSVTDRDHVRMALDDTTGGTHVSAPVIGEASGRWSIQVVRAIREEQSDRVLGVSIVSLDPVELSRTLRFSTGGEGRRLVVRRLSDGARLARSDNVEAHLQRAADPDHPAVPAARAARAGRQEYANRLYGSAVMAAFRVPDGVPVVISAIFDRSVELRSYWLWLTFTLVAYAAVSVLGLRAAVALGRRHDAQRLLREHAELDPLTGLLNRRSMEAYAGNVFAAARGTGEAISILLLDIDHFKAVNDGYGHQVGDRVLRDLAQVVRGAVRSADRVCRWGGEEILIILRDCNGFTALKRGEDLRATVEGMYAGGDGPVPGVTVSIGAAVHPRSGSNLGELVLAADLELYKAKRSGRNRVLLATGPAEAPAASEQATPGSAP